MFRLSLIEFMNNGILNDFVNEVFGYNLKKGDDVYIQYKIVKNNIILNIFDNNHKNRFKGYIFGNNSFEENDNVIYINIEECYKLYKDGNCDSMLHLIGALLKTNKNSEKSDIIKKFLNKDIKEILMKFFI